MIIWLSVPWLSAFLYPVVPKMLAKNKLRTIPGLGADRCFISPGQVAWRALWQFRCSDCCVGLNSLLPDLMAQLWDSNGIR